MPATKFCVGLLLVVAVMSPNSSAWRNTVDQQKPRADMPEMAAATINKFGLDLLAGMDRGKHENVFISPLSIFFALAMTESGAAGQTAEAMRSALRVPIEVTEEEIHQSGSELMTSLQSQKGVQLSIANALWSDARLPLSPAFVDRCRVLYHADATTLDLAGHGAADTINAWVKQKTHDKIPTIVTPADVRASLAVLTNAVYFKGGWEYTFDKSETKEGDFHLAAGDAAGNKEGGTRKVHFMHRELIRRGYRSGPGYEAAVLPYASSSIVLYAILPAPGAAPQEVLTSESLYNLRFSREAPDLELKLPKFTLDFGASLSAPLQGMGMAPAFRPGANFTPLGSSKFYIGDVLHKTRLEVDEEGTVAAAATAVTMRATAVRPRPTEKKTLVFDRPFALLLCDTRTGAILFAGVVFDPH
jgi:serpin B